MGAEEGEKRHAGEEADRVLAGADGVDEAVPGFPVPVHAPEAGEVANRDGDIALQGRGQRGQAEAPLLVLREDADAGEGAQDAVE